MNWWHRNGDDVMLAIFMILILAAFVGMCIGFVHWGHEWAVEDCADYAALNPDYDIKYVDGMGCMIRVDGLYIDKDQITNVITRR